MATALTCDKRSSAAARPCGDRTSAKGRRLPSSARGRRRPDRAARRRGGRRPRSRPLVRRRPRRPGRPGLPEPAGPRPRHRRRTPTSPSASAPACPAPSSAAPTPIPTFGARRQRGAAPRRGRRLLLLPPRRRRPRPDAIRLLVEETYRSNAGIVGPKLVTWDDPTTLARGRRRRRQVRRAGARGRAGRARPGAARRRPRRVLPVARPACSCAPTCSAPSAASTPRSPSTATSSTCAGGPTPAGPACWSCRRRGPAIGRASSDGARARRRTLASAHRLRTVLASYSGWHLLRVLPQYVAASPSSRLWPALLTGHVRRAGALARRLAVERWRELRDDPRASAAPCAGFRQVGDNEVRRLQVAGQRPPGGVLPRPGRRRGAARRDRAAGRRHRRHVPHRREPGEPTLAWAGRAWSSSSSAAAR